MHDVNDLTALRSARGRFRGFDNFGLARLYFVLDDFHYILAIFIAVFLGIPFAHHGVNKLLGHPGYFRFLSDFELTVVVDGEKFTERGTTLHELVALR